MGLVSVILLYLYNCREKHILEKKKYIQYFIYSTLFSLSCIYGYLKLNQMSSLDYRNQLNILTGTPDF